MLALSVARPMALHPILIGGVLLLLECLTGAPAVAEVPPELARWMGPQQWQRDTDGPVLSLGKSGEFDDTHLFGAMVVKDDGKYLLWYTGSQGFAHDVSGKRGLPDERIYHLGLATSDDGLKFSKHPGGPIHSLQDKEKRRSLLTPSILRKTDGTLLRENGKLRMWFSSASLGGGGRPHSIQSAESKDGIQWENVSSDLITRAYCPAVIKDDQGYQMWYTQPGKFPWIIRHARSKDGAKWTVREKPVIEITQDWENHLLTYPSVIKIGDVYLMWYTSYSHEDQNTTAVGFAASTDGIQWHKHPDNPVMISDPQRPWESHYNSSGSVILMPDGSLRMWYFARKAPPFHNLYYSICTARWAGPAKKEN